MKNNPLNFSGQSVCRLVLICLLCIPSVWGWAQNKTPIQLSYSNVPLETVLKSIEQQSKLSFFYKNNEIDVKQPVSVSMTSTDINTILDKVFQGMPIQYKVVNMQVILNKKKAGASKVMKVSGVVKDENGEPMIGVSVRVKDTSTGTITDLNGVYSVSVPSDGTLDFSYVGYAMQSVPVRNRSHLPVSMYEDAKTLNEVIVTALGIKRDEKALGYAVSKVGSDELANNTGNFLNSLSGKVAGLKFDKASSGPSSSVRVTLRGESSLNLGNNGALFVVDGVPISNGMAAAGSDAHNVGSGDMPIDFGNGASDINPEDIESLTVLKGASATALYGSRAANGAIIITTKSGAPSGKLGVSYSGTFSWDQVSRWPDLQNEYGSGAVGRHQYYQYASYNGQPSTHSSQSWGPKFENQEYYQYYNAETGLNVDADGKRVATPWRSYDNWFKGFFKSGSTYTNTVTVEGANKDKSGNMRLSVTDRRNDWIMENTGFSDQRIAFSGKQDILKRLTLTAKVNYYHKTSDNLPTVGYGPSSVMYSLLTTSPNIDMNWYRNYWIEENVEQNNRLNTNADNPYFIVYEQTNAQQRDRVFGNLSLDVKLMRSLVFTIRSGMDMSNEDRQYKRPLSSKKTPNGEYREQNIFSIETNSDFMFRYDEKFGKEKEFGILGSFGGNIMTYDYRTRDVRAETLQIPGIYKLANSKDRVLSKMLFSQKRLYSLYGLLQLSWKNFLFLDATLRNDWSSTLPQSNNSYLYPSISGSIILNELFKMNNQYLTYAKVRVSYAGVGNDTKPYSTSYDYLTTDFGGSYGLPIVAGYANLMPEMVNSFETGIDLRLFRNRLGIDLTYYNSINKNLILDVPIDPSSGAQRVTRNAASTRNRGWELSAYYNILKTRDFSWSINGTWSKNINKVLELTPGVESWIISTGPRGTVEARVGGTMSAMYGSGFLRAPEGTFATNEDGSKTDVSGKIMYDPTTGNPIVDKETKKYIGDVAPKWKGGIGTTFRWRSLSAKVLFDGQYGGQVYSLSYQKFNQFGKLEQTTVGRYDGLVGDGVVLNNDGSYSINKTVTKEIGHYYGSYYDLDNVESNMVSTSYLKLRELSIEYAFPKKWLEKTKVINSLSLAVFGNDLYCWTKYPIFDPEVATLNNSEITPGFETAQLPSTRTFGMTVKVSF